MVVWQNNNGSEMAYYQGKFVGIAGDDNHVYFAGFKTRDGGYISFRGLDNLDIACQIVEDAMQRDMTYSEWMEHGRQLLAG